MWPHPLGLCAFREPESGTSTHMPSSSCSSHFQSKLLVSLSKATISHGRSVFKMFSSCNNMNSNSFRPISRTTWRLPLCKTKGRPLFYNRGMRRTILYTSGCWQCERECWASGTQPLHGASCASVVWSLCISIGFAALRMYNALIQSKSHTLKRVCKQTCSWAHAVTVW